MAIINTNGSFGASDTVNSTNLNAVADAATFNDPVDETTLELITSGPDDGKLRIKTGGVGTNQIAGSAVTKAKIEDVANMKVLGNTSGSATAPQEVDVLDEDDMTSDSSTALATQQSIKAYVDSSITANGTVPGHTGGVANEGEQGSISIANLIIKYGTLDANSSQTNYTFTSAFPTSIIGVNATPQENYSNSAEGCSVDNLAKTGFTVRSYASSSGAAAGKVFWMAIGY